MATFTTPCVITLGVVRGRLTYLDVETGRKVEEHIGVSIDSIEPKLQGDFLYGHVVLASFATSTVKGVALGRPAYVLDTGGLRQLARRVVTTRNIKGKEFGSWEHVGDTPIFLSDVNPTVAVGASRAGSLLHINAVPSDIELSRRVWATAGVMRRGGHLSLHCVCRLGLMPYEIFVGRGNRYIVARFYLNSSSPRSKKAFFIMGEGGNVLDRREVDIGEAEAAAYELINRL
ncbi:MAG: hypothetical protein ACK4SY_03285 [Pyrobaculum sp.]